MVSSERANGVHVAKRQQRPLIQKPRRSGKSATRSLRRTVANAQFEAVSCHRLCTMLEIKIASFQAARQDLDDLEEAEPCTNDLARRARDRTDRVLSVVERC